MSESEEERVLRALQGILRCRYRGWSDDVLYADVDEEGNTLLWRDGRKTRGGTSLRAFEASIRANPDDWEIL